MRPEIDFKPDDPIRLDIQPEKVARPEKRVGRFELEELTHQSFLIG
jgi:hypothetical protein